MCLMGIISLAQKLANNEQNGKDPVITDLNMTVANLKIQGLSNKTIGQQLGMALSDVNYHLKRVSMLTQSKANGEIVDPINNHRARLMKRLEKGEKVIDYTLKPKTFKKNHQQLAIANTMTIAMYKGLGVLVDKTEVSGQVDLLAQRRDDMRARIDAMRQFGLNPADELPAIVAEVVEEKVGGADIASGKPLVCAEDNTPAPDVSRETIDKQPVIKPQPVPEHSQVDAGKPQSKRESKTLSNSKW